MLKKLWSVLWGHIKREEIKTFTLLTLILLCITSAYSLLHPLKEAIFIHTVGKLYLPQAKIVSFLVFIPILLGYNKLIDLFPKHQLFYALSIGYALSFIAIAYTLSLPAIGLSNTSLDKTRLIGWILYITVESFNALFFTLFWSFVVSITNVTSAERGYPLIVAGSQLGSIAGPELVKRATTLGIPFLFVIAILAILAIAVLVRIFTAVTTPPTARLTEKKVTGVFEGPKLLLTRPYLMGIMAVATLGEVVGSIIEYNLILGADEVYHSTENVIEFLGVYLQSVNVLSLFISLIGTSVIIRSLGIKASLLLYPLITAAVIITVCIKPSLWVMFGSIVIMKGVSYAFNSPIKEILYIPTSTDVRFKTKSWIDGFGRRLTKVVGSGANALFAPTTHAILYSSIFSLGVVGCWIFIALFVGVANQRLLDSKTIVE
ncbi:MAG: Npt1/Npt2 family nucleotide transporter [Candidatus Babeliales bacterium]